PLLKLIEKTRAQGWLWQSQAEQLAREKAQAEARAQKLARASKGLAAGGPEPGPGAWQPIETAPKTHDGLLLTDGRTVSQGGWLSQCDQGADYEGQSCAPSAGWWS